MTKGIWIGIKLSFFFSLLVAMVLCILSLNLFNISKADASESVGFYSSGSLKKALSVDENKTSIRKLFLSRGRLYTSDEMHFALNALSEYSHDHFPENNPIEVGDLSLRNGGEAKGHASHQNGLDADVIYLKKNNFLQDPNANSWQEDFISGQSVSLNFDVEKNFNLFKYIAGNLPVSRIFVDEIIKRKMCKYAKDTNQLNDKLVVETLSRLRPQDLHRTHFHLRLFCPMNDKSCTPQSEPAKDSGCDELKLKVLDHSSRDLAC